MSYDLFNDIEEKVLRDYNRTEMMMNIFEDNMVDVYNKGGERVVQITGIGIREIKNYFSRIPEDERLEVYEMFKQKLEDRGYNNVQ